MTTPATTTLKFSEVVQFLPKQRAALEAVKGHKYTLYGGSRGPGKSYWLRWMMVYLLLRWAARGLRGVRVGLFSAEYPSLKDRQISKAQVEFPAWLGTWNLSDHEFKLRPQFGSGVICFRNLDDPAKYKSAEFAAIAVEELTESKVEVFNALRGSLRWPGVEDCRFLAATNPGGVGHLWVKSYWLDNLLPPELEPLRGEFAFVRALPKDNPYLTEDYYADLNAQPEHIRKAWSDGDWSSFEGMVFGEWMTSLHVVPGLRIPKHWRWVAGLDWGYRAPACFVLAACGPDGDIVVVDELYLNAGPRKVHAKQAGYACAMLVRSYPVTVEWIAADEQMWYETGIGAPNLAEEFMQGLRLGFGVSEDAGPAAMPETLPPLIQATHGRGSRVAKLDRMHRYLDWRALKPGDEGYLHLQEKGKPKSGVQVVNGDWLVPPWGRPRLRFVSECRACIRTIPALPYEKLEGSEDVDSDAEDHAYDAVCNILMARPPLGDRPRQPPEPDRHPGLTEGGRRRATEDPDPIDLLTEVRPPHHRMPRREDARPFTG